MSEFKFIGRTRVLDFDDYVFDIDEYRRGDEQRLTAHIAFENFNKTILKKVLREWHLFRQIVTAPLFAYCGGYDQDKWTAFVSLLGFEPTGTNIICNNGETRQLFIHTVSHDDLQNKQQHPIEPLGTAGRSAH